MFLGGTKPLPCLAIHSIMYSQRLWPSCTSITARNCRRIGRKGCKKETMLSEALHAAHEYHHLQPVHMLSAPCVSLLSLGTLSLSAPLT
jgi:hypothetical protein